MTPTDAAWGEDDPEPQDDENPAYQEELFQIFKHQGWKPEDLRDKRVAEKYPEWLSRQ
jgi:hypothetical protein